MKYYNCSKNIDNFAEKHSKTEIKQVNTPLSPLPEPTISPQPQPSPVPIPTPIEPPEQDTPVLQPAQDDEVCLAAQLYNHARILSLLYQQMRNISRSNAAEMTRLLTLNNVVKAQALYIYYVLSGQSVSPRQNLNIPILGNNFCQGLVTIQNYLNEMELIARRLLQGQNIGYLNTILSDLNIQKISIENLINNC